MTAHMRWGAAVLGLLVMSGCGGGETASAPPSSPPPSPPPPSIAAAGGGPSRVQRPAAPASRDQPARETERPKLPDVPADQLFFIEKEDPGVELVPPSGDGQLYAVVLPEAGRDSRAVGIVPPTGGESGTQSSASGSSITLPAGFTAVREAGYTAAGIPRQIRCTADSSVMVLVPGGLFVQGEDGVDPDAGPAHPVHLDPYYMDRTEVTLAQYARFRSEYTPRAPAAANDGDPSDFPAVGIAWRSAVAYCRWSKKELPTEAEWEKAARGPDAFLYPWGEGRVIWSRARTPSQIDPVMSFPTDRSVYGVFDLAGNAREWCSDYYDPDYYAEEVARFGSLLKNPTGPNRPAISAHRVVRGNAADWQLWHRGSEDMSKSPADVGFRCVLRISAPEEDAGGRNSGTGSAEPPPTQRPAGSGSRN